MQQIPHKSGRRASITESGTIHKKWTGLLPIALLYPNTYAIGSANLGMQIVYQRLNLLASVVCERFFLPENTPLRSQESNRPLRDFPLIFCAVSFEHDYFNLVRMLAVVNVRPNPGQRAAIVNPGSPLVVMGGVAVTINPEPMALFADILVIGEAEPVLDSLLDLLSRQMDAKARRADILIESAGIPGCYVPSFYDVQYDDTGRIAAVLPQQGAPKRVQRQFVRHTELAEHSRLLSAQSEMNLYMTEMGRGCGRACRFCAAGFVYRPPRLWSAEAIERGLAELPKDSDRVGLLGMEMIEPEVMERVAAWLGNHGCKLSFSSLRADRLTDALIETISSSELKSAAIALDGTSRRLRLVINKGLDEQDLLSGALRLIEAGIVNLKLYVMIGLPTESDEDIKEFIDFVQLLRHRILEAGRKRGQVATLTLSVNSFVPKPWTPFQYHAFGSLDDREARYPGSERQAVKILKQRFKILHKALGRMPNLRIKADRPERALEQAVFARADRRLAPALHGAAVEGKSLKQALAEQNIKPGFYAMRPRPGDELLPWEIIDQGIEPEYLYQEYQRALAARATPACVPKTCRRCGVCHGQS